MQFRFRFFANALRIAFTGLMVKVGCGTRTGDDSPLSDGLSRCFPALVFLIHLVCTSVAGRSELGVERSMRDLEKIQLRDRHRCFRWNSAVLRPSTPAVVLPELPWHRSRLN